MVFWVVQVGATVAAKYFFGHTGTDATLAGLLVFGGVVWWWRCQRAVSLSALLLGPLPCAGTRRQLGAEYNAWQRERRAAAKASYPASDACYARAGAERHGARTMVMRAWRPQ